MKRLSHTLSLPLWFYRALQGQIMTGFRGNAIKGASIFDMAGRLGLYQSGFMRASVAHLREDPEISRALDERWLAPAPDVPALLKLPEDTLGYAYARLIADASYDPHFYSALPYDDDVSYLNLRMRQLHDLLHVLLGFGTDFCGELAVLGFAVAQHHDGLSTFVLGTAQIRTVLIEPQELPRLMAHVACGYEMGARARPVLAQKPELAWDRPLEEWRRELGIIPRPPWLQPRLAAPLAPRSA